MTNTGFYFTFIAIWPRGATHMTSAAIYYKMDAEYKDYFALIF